MEIQLHIFTSTILHKVIYVLFWYITQRWVVVLYRRLGTTYRSHLQVTLTCWISWPLKMGPIGSPETLAQNLHSTLCNIPEERRSHLHRGGRLKSRPRLSAGSSAVLDELPRGTFWHNTSIRSWPLSYQILSSRLLIATPPYFPESML
jgi:hypothetical protein